MLFSSIVFLFTFLPIVLILYYVLPRQFKNPVLLLASLLFYAWGEPIYLFLMMFSILFNYISGLDIATDFYNNEVLENAIIYIDACASAVGIANGLFIFFRFREQWIAWYICAALEAAINILSGQYVLLILKLGYFTNTTYGYIKWTKYIKTHKEAEQLSIF